MIFKIAALGAVLFLVYIVFFKRNRENINKRKKDEEVDTMFECPSCKTYVAKDDSILSNGKYFCSQKCLGK